MGHLRFVSEVIGAVVIKLGDAPDAVRLIEGLILLNEFLCREIPNEYFTVVRG